jgi:hypothetical protein
VCNRIESLDFDVLVDGSKFYKGLRIHVSVKELQPNIYFDPIRKIIRFMKTDLTIFDDKNKLQLMKSRCLFWCFDASK